MTLEERIKACISAHPDWDDKRVGRAIRGSRLAIVQIVRAGGQLPDEVTAADVGTITLDSVKARYDTASAIRSYVIGLKRGVLKLEREVAQQTASKDAGRFRRTVENNAEEFRSFRVKLKLDPDQPEGSWYWGNKETIAEAIRLRDSV